MRVEFSDELMRMLGELTPKQRAAIPRIVAHRAEGGSLTSLLKGEGKVCTWSTYYRRRRGWHHNGAFQRTLARAQEEYDRARLERSVADAAERIRRAAPVAIELAEETVRAAVGKGDGPDGGAVQRLVDLMQSAEKDAGQQVRAAGVLLGKGLQAALSILDRADVETAVKASGGDQQRWADILERLRGLGDEDGEVAELEAEAGDIPDAGVQAAPEAGDGAPVRGAGDPGSGGGESG